MSNDETMGLAEFKASIHAQFPEPFKLHRAVALLLEPAVEAPRDLSTSLHLAIDMLFVQSYKAHLSVHVVAEHGHMEDAATLARRLLELATAAGYIGLAKPSVKGVERAKRYLADLWNDLPEEGRAGLPAAVQAQWAGISKGAPPGALPSFQKMFGELNAQATYDQDYRLLARIAHGASSDQLIAYASTPVPVRATWHLGTLLVFASRYYLATTNVWNHYFNKVDQSELEHLTSRVAAWAPPDGASAS